MPILTHSHIHTWFNEPVAVEVNNCIYYGIYSQSAQPAVAKYDKIKRILQIGSPRLDPIDFDDHNNPAVTVLNDGKILLVYSNHPGETWAALSNNPYDVMGGWEETLVCDGANYYSSYAHICQTRDDKNTIWCFFRDGQTIETPMPISIRFNQSGGSGYGWTPQDSIVKLITHDFGRPYFRIVQSDKRVDIMYNNGNPAESVVNSLYHVYLTINQSGTQFSAYKSNNTLIDTWGMTGGTGIVNGVVLPFNIASGTQVFDGASQRSWVWDTRYVNGNLNCAYVVFSTASGTDDVHKYRRALYNGTSWVNEDVCYAGDSLNPLETGRIPHWIVSDSNPSTNAVYSPGICLDPNVSDRVYVGKKYGSQDVRIQQWDKIDNVWNKTSDLTGVSGNNAVNARPFSIIGSNPTNIIWFCASSYLSWTSYVLRDPGTKIPLDLARTTKITNASWYPKYAPPGIKGFYLMNDGSGSVVRDVTRQFNASIQGGLTWNSDNYGPYLSGFSSTASVISDNIARSGYFNASVYPKWAAIFYRSLDDTSPKYLFGMGNSGTNNPLFAISDNTNAANQIGCMYRDNNNINNNVVVTQTRDSSYHTAMIVIPSASSVFLFRDGQYKHKLTNNIPGPVDFNTLTFGGLRRTIQGFPATNCIISVVQLGTGLIPHPLHVHSDMYNMQMLGSWDADSVGSCILRVKKSYIKRRPGLSNFYIHIQ